MRFIKSRAQYGLPSSGAEFRPEPKLRLSADGSSIQTDAQSYRPFVLGLIYLRHIDQAFQRKVRPYREG